MIMAILALYFQAIKFRKVSQAMAGDNIDLVANGLVLLATVLGVVFWHIDHADRDFG